MQPLFCFFYVRLLTQAKSLDDSAVAVDIAVLQVVEESATLTYELSKCSFSAMIFTVLLHVLREIRYENNAIWLSDEPVSELDFPYCPKISFFLAESKYIIIRVLLKLS